MGTKEDDFFEKSVETMTQAVYQFRDYASDSERHCLSKILAEYQAHTEEYIGYTRRCADSKSGVSFLQRLARFIGRFDACISSKSNKW